MGSSRQEESNSKELFPGIEYLPSSGSVDYPALIPLGRWSDIYEKNALKLNILIFLVLKYLRDFIYLNDLQRFHEPMRLSAFSRITRSLLT